MSRNARRTLPEAQLRRRLFRLLRWAEQQEDSGIATVTDRGAPLGDLLLSRGRLCLAIPARPCPQDAGGLAPYLADLVQKSRLAGTFSAAVAGAGRSALQHARGEMRELLARNLCCMVGGTVEDTLQAALRPVLDDYEPGLTFSSAEVLVACLARTLGPLDALGTQLLETLDCSTLLVLTRSEEEAEMPYPIACRGLDDLAMVDLFKMARTASLLCARAPAPPAAGDVEVVSLSEGTQCWHFVGGARRVVAVRAEPAHADESLSRAISVAIGR